MYFSASLIAALASGALALPNYGYAAETTCTEEESQPTPYSSSSASVYHTKAPVYSSSSAPVYHTKAPVYSSPAPAYEDPESTSCTEEEYAHATGYSSYGAPAYSSVYSAYPTKPTYPAVVYPSGNNGTYPSGIATPSGGLIYSSSSTSIYYTPSTTATSTSADPISTSTTSTSSAPTTTPTDDPGCGSEENPCDGGEVPCDGCDGDPIDGGDVPNPDGPDNGGDGSPTDAEICGASNTPSCCAVPVGQDGVFVDSPNCAAADPLTGCPTGTTYCCPLTDDMSAIDQTMQCAVINLFLN